MTPGEMNTAGTLFLKVGCNLAGQLVGYLTNAKIDRQLVQQENDAMIVLGRCFFRLSNPKPDVIAASLKSAAEH